MTIFQISSIVGHFYHLPFLLGTYVLGHSDLVINDYIFIQESKHNQGYCDQLKTKRNDILINLCGLSNLLCLLWGLRRGWNELSQVLTVKGINRWQCFENGMHWCCEVLWCGNSVEIPEYSRRMEILLVPGPYCCCSEFWENSLLLLLLFLYNKSSIICVITQDSTLSI